MPGAIERATRGYERMTADRGPTVRGLDEARQKVYDFLERTIGTVEIPPGQPLSAQLFQMNFNGNEPFEVFEFNPEEDSKESLVEAIVESAGKDAADAGKASILYCIMLAHHSGRKQFTLTVNDNSLAMDPEDPDNFVPIATQRAWQSQLIGQHQFMFGASMGALGEAMKVLQQSNRQLLERNQYLEKAREEDSDRRNAAIADEHRAKMEAHKAEKDEMRKERFFNLLETSVPSVINTWAQKKVIPTNVTPFEAQVLGLLGTFKMEHLEKLQKSGIFDIIQLKAFADLFSSAQAIEEAARQQAAVQSSTPVPQEAGPNTEQKG